MKKTFTTSILLAVLSFTALTASAKSWRINNDATKKADFADLNAAMSSTDVEAGDTLYLDPGCSISGDQTVTKRVTIVGSGYFRMDTPHRFSYITGKLYLKAQYIKVEGVLMTSNLRLNADYITVERCKIPKIEIVGLWTEANARYATIRQCYLQEIEGQGGDNSSYKHKSSFATIENCIIINDGYMVQNLYNPTITNCFICHTGTITNDYYAPLYNISEGAISNNILMNNAKNTIVSTSVTNSVVTNNVMSCAEDTYPEYTTNNRFLNSTDESLVFKLEGIYDQMYELKDDSPAKGYGADGTDCGPSGGTYPYVLNGLPAGYPYYTKASIGPRAKDGKINVSLNIKMQNE